MKKGVLLPDGRIACPVCRSTEHRLKRSAGAKVGLGVVALPLILAAPKRVKCLSCGELYQARAERTPVVRALPPPAPTLPVPAEPGTVTRTLRVTRSVAFPVCVDAVVQVRPDLTREQAKQLLKDSRKTPQVLLADAAVDEVNAAGAVLGQGKVVYDIV